MSDRGPMSDSRAVIRGAEIAYEVNGSGQPLIWGHGLSQTRLTDSALPLLDWNGVPARVVRYDARGHGASETTEDLDGYSWSELARDQLALADHLQIDTYVAAGASMGCGTALWAAVHSPERISRLVLVIPPTGWETRAAQAEIWEEMASIIENDGVEAMIAARADIPPPDPLSDDPDYRARRDEAARTWEPARLAHVMRGAGRADLPPRQTLRSIEVPSLVLAWTGDNIHPMSTADELEQLLPDVVVHRASSRQELDSWTGVVASFIT
jgi:pimeloyl-ACP methyl ester carboxylesterase